MQKKYSIEEYASRILDPRTKEAFQEVIRCHDSGCYRSCVAMLWPVAVCDLVFKLQKLEEIYKDEKATTILTEIKEMRDKHRNSSTWEDRLLELVEEKTELLDKNEYNNLLHLRKTRHLSVHPQIDLYFQFSIFDPGEYDTRLLIFNTLEEVLTKRPGLSKNSFGELVKDLEKNSYLLTNDEQLGPYLYRKYYGYFTTEVKQYVFRHFWKFVFKLDDEKCNKNRDINYRAFLFLYNDNPTMFQLQITEDKEHFSKIARKGPPVIYLIDFFAYQPSIYKLLSSEIESIIENAIEVDPSARFLAHFTSENLDEHIEKLENWIRKENPEIEDMTWKSLQNISNSSEWIRKVTSLKKIHERVK